MLIHTKFVPQFHPTTTVFVDDNPNFLSALALYAPDTIPCEFFTSAKAALNRLRMDCARPWLNQHGKQDSLSMPGAAPPILERDRFGKVSTLVLDYEMGEMNGIEFCEQLNMPDVYVILLTGQADDKTAVRAFNRGLIDLFIPKQSDAIADDVWNAVRTMQHRYWERIFPQRLYSGTLMLDDFNDPLVLTQFEQTKRALEIVEYYEAGLPNTLLMIDIDANSHLFVLLTSTVWDFHREVCADAGAPREILDSITNRTALPLLWPEPAPWWHPDEWHARCLTVSSVGASDTMQFCVARNVPLARRESLQSFASFRVARQMSEAGVLRPLSQLP
jgi:CheY-like chemotaxis protein